MCRCFVERCGNVVVRLCRGEREMTCAFLLIGECAPEPCVEFPLIGGAGACVRTGCEQWMREADRAVLERNDFRLHGRSERMQDVAVDCEADQPDGRLCKRGSNGEYAPRCVGQCLQALLNQVLESRWQLVGAGRGALELDRIERVSSGELVDSSEQRPRERFAAALLQQAMQRAEAERAERNAMDELFVERVLDLGSRLPRLDAPRNDEHQRLVSEASSRVSEGRPRGRVEPLHVIDCDRDGPVARQDLERCEERRRNGPLVGWLPARILEEERDLECAPLRWGKLGERLLANAGQKVADAGQRQDGLGLCGACPEDAKPASFRGLRCGVPNRCLADPSLALEQQRPRQRPVEEGLDLLEFGVAADDRGGARLHPPRMMLRRGRAGYAAAWRTLIVGAPPEQVDRRVAAAVAVSLTSSGPRPTLGV